MKTFLCRSAAASVLLLSAGAGAAELPDTVVWTAYGLGSGGSGLEVGIGSALKNERGVTLRILPGNNDLSRLVPVRDGRADFSANGLGTYMAQEAAFEFAERGWGPQPVRTVMMSIGDYCLMPLAPDDLGVKTAYDLKGLRVAVVKAAPALNYNLYAYLRFADLTWDDVRRVPFAGVSPALDSIVDGHADVSFTATVAASPTKLEASPRGLAWPEVPHDDGAGWTRFLQAAPYYIKQKCTVGAGGLSDENPVDGGTYPFPVLTAYADKDPDFVYAMAKAMVDLFDEYKDAAPGANGWALERQKLDWVVPAHEGAVRLFRERGVWTADHQANNEELIARQQVLRTAWDRFLAEIDATGTEDLGGPWAEARAAALQAAGLPVVWQSFD